MNISAAVGVAGNDDLPLKVTYGGQDVTANATFTVINKDGKSAGPSGIYINNAKQISWDNSHTVDETIEFRIFVSYIPQGEVVAHTVKSGIYQIQA